jgi:hypothetical protein
LSESSNLLVASNTLGDTFFISEKEVCDIVVPVTKKLPTNIPIRKKVRSIQ